MPNFVTANESLAITVPRVQAVAAGEWIYDAPDSAGVQLELRGETLIVSQGDDGASFNRAGREVGYEPGKEGDTSVGFSLAATDLKRRVKDASLTDETEVTLIECPANEHNVPVAGDVRPIDQIPPVDMCWGIST